MSSSTTTTASHHVTPPEASRLLDFWFTGDFSRWFKSSDSFDNDLRTKFLPLVHAARSSSLDSWKASPKGTLALLILLDQIPRNIFRGSKESYASDGLARDIAVNAIAREVDRSKELKIIERSFIYLPLMHDENLVSQIACLAYYEALLAQCPGSQGPSKGVSRVDKDEELMQFVQDGVDMAKRHVNCILRFGRFPARNEALGRESTEEEKAFLKEHAMGF